MWGAPPHFSIQQCQNGFQSVHIYIPDLQTVPQEVPLFVVLKVSLLATTMCSFTQLSEFYSGQKIAFVYISVICLSLSEALESFMMLVYVIKYS